MTPYTYYYAFAAKSIQNFILRGGQLKLAIGGSELVEQLPRSFLLKLLDQLMLKEGSDYRILSQSAGGARVLFGRKEAAEALVRFMPLALDLYAPELDFVQTALPLNGGLAYTMNEAGKTLQQRRNLVFPRLPVAGPLVERSLRSGLPAVTRADFFGEGEETFDAAALARREKAKDGSGSLLAKIFPDEIRPMASWVEEISSEQEYLATLHADANGLGAIVGRFLGELQNIESIDEAADRYARFSQSIEVATINALKKALEPIRERSRDADVLPFRLLVCAGDDVTLLLNAKDAVPVAKEFLLAFETESKQQLDAGGISSLQNGGLTACAGIVFAHRKYPYAQAYELCESLTGFAKDQTKRNASALAFRRITSGTTSDYDAILKSELTTPEGILLTQCP